MTSEFPQSGGAAGPSSLSSELGKLTDELNRLVDQIEDEVRFWGDVNPDTAERVHRLRLSFEELLGPAA
jgi:hypothetical protein